MFMPLVSAAAQEVTMVATRWGALVAAFVLAASASTALAKDHDRDRDRDDWRRRPVYREGRVSDIAFSNGYDDGYEKGLDDGHDRRSFDPTRHKWYRAGDRHYDSRYGPRSIYENTYRQGFRRGYDAGYRDGDRRNERRGRIWPF
jgi:hypothetical protein